MHQPIAVRRYLPLRLVEASPLPNWLTCTIYGALCYAALWIALRVTDADMSEAVYTRSLILIPFLAGYMSMLSPVVARSTASLSEELAPLIRPDASGDQVRSRLYSLSGTSLLMWTLVFQLVPAAAQLLAIERDSTADWVIFWARQILFLHYTFYVFLYAQLRGVAQFVNQRVDVDLHHRDELVPIGRLGIRLASVVALALTVVGVIQIALSADVGVLFMTAIMSSPGYALVGIAMWMPSQPVRRKLQDAKRRELARINQALRERTSLDVLGQPTGGVELLTYRDRVREASTIPIDLATMRTVAVFFVLPLISWVAAAFIEVGVERMFGG